MLRRSYYEPDQVASPVTGMEYLGYIAVDTKHSDIVGVYVWQDGCAIALVLQIKLSSSDIRELNREKLVAKWVSCIILGHMHGGIYSFLLSLPTFLPPSRPLRPFHSSPPTHPPSLPPSLNKDGKNKMLISITYSQSWKLQARMKLQNWKNQKPNSSYRFRSPQEERMFWTCD